MLTVQFPSFRNSRGSHTNCFCAELWWDESVCENFLLQHRVKGFHWTSLVGATVFFFGHRQHRFFFVGLVVFVVVVKTKLFGAKSQQHVLAACFVCIVWTAQPFFDLKHALEPREPARFQRTFQIEKRFGRSRDPRVTRYPRSGPLKGPYLVFRLYRLNGSSVFWSETCVGTARASANPTHFSDRKTVRSFARSTGEKISSKWSLKGTLRVPAENRYVRVYVGDVFRAHF